MPDRVLRNTLRFIDRWHSPILLMLGVALIIALIFAISGYTKAESAHEALAAERLGKHIADVTTCFNQAQSRPRLILILRGIQAEVEPDPRQALAELIDEYERSTPSRADCSRLARELGIDPAPYLRNPPSQATQR